MFALLLGLVASAAFAMLGAAAPQAESSAPAVSAGLSPEYLYNGGHRAARITVDSPKSFGTISLALMDAQGNMLADRIEVHPGVVDLDEKLPAIWNIRRTAYLQKIEGEAPIGSALVLQPMLSRMIPVTQVRPHPVSGKPHSRIIDWKDENDPIMQEPPKTESSTQPAANGNKPAIGASTSPADQSQANSTQPAATSSAPIERLFTGLRMYPERDVVLHTTQGDIRLAMRPDEAPNTVWNFLELCRGGFYRDVAFHRIVPFTGGSPPHPFVIQAGDPTATGDGGPGYWLPMEDSKLPHDFGVISMARSDDPDSNGSQIFIALSREGTARLDGQYCAFGYAVDGAQTILAIAQTRLADVAAGRPADPPLIRSAELMASPPRVLNQGRPDERVTPQSTPAQPRPSGRIPR